jgi:hypothetical protein
LLDGGAMNGLVVSYALVLPFFVGRMTFLTGDPERFGRRPGPDAMAMLFIAFSSDGVKGVLEPRDTSDRARWREGVLGFTRGIAD